MRAFHQEDKALVERYFEAMRAGAAGEAMLMQLFSEDATYIEPFSGTRQTHQGREAIRSAFRSSWQHTPPNLSLTVARIDLDGEQISAHWICDSPAFETPVHGRDLYTISDGMIHRLEVNFVPVPAHQTPRHGDTQT